MPNFQQLGCTLEAAVALSALFAAALVATAILLRTQYPALLGRKNTDNPPSTPNLRISPATEKSFWQNFQAGPYLAAHPRDSSVIFVAFNDANRCSQPCTFDTALNRTTCSDGTDGRSSLAGYALSLDGGRTWTNGYIPTNMAGSIGEVHGDTVAVWGPKPLPSGGFSATDFRLYFFAIVNYVDTPFTPAWAYAMTYSDDLGASWIPLRIIDRTVALNSPAKASDHADAAVDTNTASPYYGRIYITYQSYEKDEQEICNSCSPPAGFPVGSIAEQHSSDGGAMWSNAQVLQRFNTNKSSNNDVVGDAPATSIAVGGNGVVYVIYMLTDGVFVSTSASGGSAWSTPRLAAAQPFPAFPDSYAWMFNWFGAMFGVGARTYLNRWPTIAAARDNGKAFVAYNYQEYDPVSKKVHVRAMVARSDDYGQTWSAGKTVADYADRSIALPTVTTSRDGSKVAVGYVYVPEFPLGTPQGVYAEQNAALVLSTDGGATFGAPLLVSDAPCDASAGMLRNFGTGLISDWNSLRFDADGNLLYAWGDSRNAANCPPAWDYANGRSPGLDLASACPGNSVFDVDVYFAAIRLDETSAYSRH